MNNEPIYGLTLLLVLPPARPFSLLADTVTDNAAGRKWSDAYLALTQSWPLPKNGGYRAYHVNKLTCWVSTHSGPEVQPSYSVGAARSGLIAMLEKGHNGVRLTREELDKFICWIDLAVPFCGDYDEANAWTDEELKTYAATMQKRAEQEALDHRNIEELIHEKHVK